MPSTGSGSAQQDEIRSPVAAGGAAALPGLDLFALLAVVVVLDLLVAKVAVPLAHPDLLQDVPRWYPYLVTAGAFIHYFTGSLAVVVTAYYLLRAGLRRDLFPLALRALLATATVVFAVLAAVNVIGGPLRDTPLPPILRFDLRMAFAGVVALLTIGLCVRRAALGSKIAAVALALPIVLWAAATVAAFSIHEPSHAALARAATLRGCEAWVALLVPAILFATLLPRPVVQSLRRPAPLVVALVVTVLVAVFERSHADDLMRAVRNTLGYELPLQPSQLLVFGLAFFLEAAIVLSLLQEGTARRRMSYGLFLVAASGVTLWWASDVTVSAAGFLAFALGAARDGDEAAARAVQPTPERWEAFARSLAASIAGSPGSAGGGGGATRILGERQGLPVHVVLRRGPLGLDELRIDVGGPDVSLPAWTLDGGSGGPLAAHPGAPLAPGPRITTGDDALDAHFRVRDAAGITTEILDGDVRTRLLARFDGWLGVWPAQGVRYVATAADRHLVEVVPMAEIAFHEDAGDPALLERLLGLIDTLVLIARRAQIEAPRACEDAEPPTVADETSLQS